MAKDYRMVNGYTILNPVDKHYLDTIEEAISKTANPTDKLTAAIEAKGELNRMINDAQEFIQKTKQVRNNILNKYLGFELEFFKEDTTGDNHGII